MDSPAADVGIDDAGLIAGYRFEPSGLAHVVSLAEAAAVLSARGDAADAAHFMWLHFTLAHAGTTRWLARHAFLPAGFAEALADPSGSTRLEREDEALIAVFNDLRLDFSFDASDLATLWVVLQPGLMVTVRRTPLRGVDDLRMRIRAGEPMRSVVELLEQLMRAQAGALVQTVRTLTQRVDDIEDEFLHPRRPTLRRERLGSMRRLLVRLQRLLAPEPASLYRMLQQPPAWMDAADVQGLREASEEFSLVVRDMGLLQERIKLLQEELAAEANEATGRSLYLLTVFTVLALPINLTAGLFGMNVGGIPLAEHPLGFLLVSLSIVGVTALAGWAILRRSRR